MPLRYINIFRYYFSYFIITMLWLFLWKRKEPNSCRCWKRYVKQEIACVIMHSKPTLVTLFKSDQKTGQSREGTVQFIKFKLYSKVQINPFNRSWKMLWKSIKSAQKTGSRCWTKPYSFLPGLSFSWIKFNMDTIRA